MRHDNQGLFWNEVDGRTERKITKLTKFEWAEVLPGYWAESKYIRDPDEDEYSYCIPMETAYELVKKQGSGVKCEPPEPVWLSPDFLPFYEEAKQFNVTLFTDDELVEAGSVHVIGLPKHKLEFDIECYPNYFLIAFKSIENGKIVFFEMYPGCLLNIPKLKWVIDNFCLIGFNSNGYDMPIAALALAGYSNGHLRDASVAIIEEGIKAYILLRTYKVKKLKGDHIDLMEVAPLKASLKIYGGRMHSKRMQDLPFPPEIELTPQQIVVMRWYCINDLNVTGDLFKNLKKDIDLRIGLGAEHGLDLRSKSDAQIAEAVISTSMQKITKQRSSRPTIAPGTIYKYNDPGFLIYQTPLMRSVIETVLNAHFIVSEAGSIGMPVELADLKINMGQSTYKLGIGGLHSTEKKVAHFADKYYTLEDWDVESYYPRIILNQGLFPHHLGPVFLQVYESIVNRRLAAKHSGDKATSGSLKIVINGSFGKLGSKYSVLYSPDLLIQTTMTGQLSLLMLIEALELNNISVVSANTDGIVIKCHESKQALKEQILKWWQNQTQFILECTAYSAVYSRDVNNYIAIKTNPEDEPKTKGAFATGSLRTNPTCDICAEAVALYLQRGTPLTATIYNCTTPSKFVAVRTVKGGGVKVSEGKPPEFLGKAVRWYYAKNETGGVVYARSGNKVPKSDGAKPLMDMGEAIPADIDYEWYVAEAEKILSHIGAA